MAPQKSEVSYLLDSSRPTIIYVWLHWSDWKTVYFAKTRSVTITTWFMWHEFFDGVFRLSNAIKVWQFCNLALSFLIIDWKYEDLNGYVPCNRLRIQIRRLFSSIQSDAVSNQSQNWIRNQSQPVILRPITKSCSK